VTEAEWLACRDLRAMWASAFAHHRPALRRAWSWLLTGEGHVPLPAATEERKARLFALACCRRLLLHRSVPDRPRQVLALFARFVDGHPGPDALPGCGLQRPGPLSRLVHGSPLLEVIEAAIGSLNNVARATGRDLAAAVWDCAALARQAIGPPDSSAGPHATEGGWAWGQVRDWWRRCRRSREVEEAAQCALLRDLFPYPGRRAAARPEWLAANDGIAPRLAQAIDADRAYDRLPILADALEDAGCANDALLAHLRSPGRHVRGCWALDLVLGKE